MDYFACRCFGARRYNSRLKRRVYARPQATRALLFRGTPPRQGRPTEAKSPMASVEDKVKECIVSQLGVNEDEVTPEASFIDDLGADSLDIVELVMALEDKFGIEIPDEDVEKMRTVKDAIDYVNSKSGE